MASVDTRAIEGEIDRIRSLGLEDLRREWRRLNHAEPPRISRDLLVLALGYRLQEIEHGGLGKATRRKLFRAESRKHHKRNGRPHMIRRRVQDRVAFSARHNALRQFSRRCE